ncbi:hypothetical protein GRI89_11815 [Altererythrobacter salegens]|uniref:Uncharacterized protein n=1 Tax=Croceibacterium salegens TaxID=1737568 RepID=A0A6I4SZJ4_9SPHN|nr:hypothetical protein [Croceibacterium salegens]MXO60226.1 hypothetical protein [Croceibacterium salegens]
MIVLRGLAAFLFALIAGLFLLIGFLPTDTENVRQSLADQKAMHADMIKMGDFTERYRKEFGRLASAAELQDWGAKQDFQYVGFQRLAKDGGTDHIALSIVPTGEEFIVGDDSALPNDGHSYRIAYWNNWTEEYAPETGANTFATSIADYAPPLWERALAIAMALAFSALTVWILRGKQSRREVVA